MKILCTVVLLGAIFLCVESSQRRSQRPPLKRRPIAVSTPDFCGDYQCPNFTVVKTTADFEVRRYEPTAFVGTTADGGWFQNIRMYFRLAAYMYGGYNAEGVRMKMTVPVLTKVSESQPETMYFMLPQETQQNPPTPTNPMVTIVNKPAFEVYVRSFGGYATNSKFEQQVDALKAALTPDLPYEDGVMFKADYNTPWTFYNRHNEVWLVKK